MSYTWIGHRRTRIARLIAGSGLPVYSSGYIHFVGGLEKDFMEADRCAHTFMGTLAERGILITPHMLDLSTIGFHYRSDWCSVDSAQYGDVLSDRWNLYAFGSFPLEQLLNHLKPSTPSTLGSRYIEHGYEHGEDVTGFLQIIDIPYSLGKEIRVVAEDGRWFYSVDSLFPCSPPKVTLNSGWLWPIPKSSQPVPSVGQRLHILGRLSNFAQFNLSDYGFCHDSLWRLTPRVIWNNALQCLGGPPETDPYDETGICSSQNQAGGEKRGPHQRSQAIRRNMDWSARNKQNDGRGLRAIQWANVERDERRGSVQLGPGGVTGLCQVTASKRCPGSSALPDRNSSGNADCAANFTWGFRPPVECGQGICMHS